MRTEAVPISAVSRAVRMVLIATTATLAMGLALSVIVAGPTAPVAEALLWLGLGMLIAIPVLNVIDVLIIEWRLKEWPFAGAAVAVLVLLAYTVVDKLSK